MDWIRKRDFLGWDFGFFGSAGFNLCGYGISGNVFGWVCVGWVGDDSFCGTRTLRMEVGQALSSLWLQGSACLAQPRLDTVTASRKALAGQVRRRLNPFGLGNLR